MQAPFVLRIGKRTRQGVVLLALLATQAGCVLERRPLFPPFGQVTPTEYCPGDTLTASYDFLFTDTCRAGADCIGPTIDVSAVPAVFPPTRLTGFTNSLSFTATSAPVIDVTFRSDRMPVTVPVTRTMPDGTRINVERTFVNPVTSHLTLFNPGPRTFSHDGLCAGSSPSYAFNDLPGAGVSSRVRPSEICNTSGVATIVNLTGDGLPGSLFDWSTPLAIGECVPLPADVAAMARRITARPQVPDLSARCSAVTGSTPPRTLRTDVTLACAP